MFKQILALLILAVVVQSQNNNNSNDMRIDEYIEVNRRLNALNIENYDSQMNTFKRIFSAEINTIYRQRDMLTDSLLQSDEYLLPLQILNDTAKHCVNQYRPIIPTVESVTKTINTCATTASDREYNLLYYPRSTRNLLQSYYANTYETQLTNCKRSSSSQQGKYADCVVTATTSSNNYTITNQKTFAAQMKETECSASAVVQIALDCSFSALNRTVALTTEANLYINRCLQGIEVNCRCNQLYSCPNVYRVPQSQVNYNQLTMINPFFGRKETDCLMLDLN